MKLTELAPKLKYLEYPPMASITYDCPECRRKGAPDHRIYCPLDIHEVPEPGVDRPIWGFSGSSYRDFSLTGSRVCALRSTRVMGGCKGHWDIVNGEIIFHGDSGQ